MNKDSIVSQLNSFFERDFALPAGAFSQGSMNYLPYDVCRAVWTAGGGAVMCADQRLVDAITVSIMEYPNAEPGEMLGRFSAVITESGAGCVSLDIGLYCIKPVLPPQQMLDRVEILRPQEMWPDDDSPLFEHVAVIREDSVVVSHAENRVQHLDSMTLHALGVATHPDYRNRGFGGAVVAALADHIAGEGGVSLWNCDATNTASLRLARSVGFVELLWVLRWS